MYVRLSVCLVCLHVFYRASTAGIIYISIGSAEVVTLVSVTSTLMGVMFLVSTAVKMIKSKIDYRLL